MAAPTATPVSPAPPAPPAPAAPPPLRTGQSLTGRALLALAFLAGFYVLALGVIAALVAANVAAYSMANRLYPQLVLLAVVVGLAVARGVFFVDKGGEAELPGLPVDPAREPELTGLVRSVAKDMGTEPPSRLLLVPDVNAYVTQTGGMLGLRPGERVMTLGVALIESLSVDQLRGVVAHELGHYAGGDTRLGPLTYRAGASIYRTVDHLGDDTLLGRLFAAYGSRFLLMTQRVRRGQELSADAAAVWLAGRDNHTSALRRTEATGAAFSHLLRSYVAPLWSNDCDPANAFEGFRRLLDEPSRQAELAEVEEAAIGIETSRYDSHPSLAERVAHAATLPEGPSAGLDGRPARALLRDAEGIERQVSRLLTAEITGRRFDRLVEWDDPATAPLYAEGMRQAGDAVLRAAAEVTGEPEAANLATTIQLVEAGRGDDLAAALTDDPTERADALCTTLGGALAAYLATERDHSWAISWAGPLQLVDPQGSPKDAFALAQSLIDDPSSGPKLRRSLGGVARLAAFTATPVEADTGAGPAGPQVIDVLPSIGLGRKSHDLVVTTEALVFHPVKMTLTTGLAAGLAVYGLGGQARNVARKRLEALFEQGPEAVLGGAPGAVVVPLSTVGVVHRRFGHRLRVDRTAGAGAPLKLGFSSKELRVAFQEALEAARTRHATPQE